MTIIQRLDAYCEENGVVRYKMAKQVGIPQSTLASWVDRGQDFPARYVIPICEALGISPEWLLTGEGDPKGSAPAVVYREQEKPVLTDNEQFLLETLRSLDREGQIVVCNKAIEELRRFRAESGEKVSASSVG